MQLTRAALLAALGTMALPYEMEFAAPLDQIAAGQQDDGDQDDSQQGDNDDGRRRHR